MNFVHDGTNPLTYYAQERDRQRGAYGPGEEETCPYNLIASLAEINEGINTSVTWGFKPMDHMIH